MKYTSTASKSGKQCSEINQYISVHETHPNAKKYTAFQRNIFELNEIYFIEMDGKEIHFEATFNGQYEFNSHTKLSTHANFLEGEHASEEGVKIGKVLHHACTAHHGDVQLIIIGAHNFMKVSDIVLYNVWGWPMLSGIRGE